MSRVKKAIIADIQKDQMTRTAIAKKHKVSRNTVYLIAKEIGELKSPSTAPADLDTDIKMRSYKAKIKANKQAYEQAARKIAELEQSLATWEQFRGMKEIVPDVINYKSRHKKHDAIPILVASDWHIDEVVEGDSIGHVNHYNPSVADERVNKLFAYTVKLLEICKQDSDIDTLLIAALGDFMSAWLHDELVQTNSMTPMEVILRLLELWTGGLDYILASGVVDKIIFVGACGNHGRITKRIQFKDRHKKSYEWLLYNLLARHYAAKNDTRIQFKMPTGYFNWVEVFGKRIRFHHGDNIRYQGGVGGVHIPVRKAISQWNKTRWADLDVFGHWHGLEWSQSYVINGSAIGYSAYAENLKADYQKAAQALFLMHSRCGKTAQFPIILQD